MPDVAEIICGMDRGEDRWRVSPNEAASPKSRSGGMRHNLKLRDSCQSCAMSKIKCPKEKPSCSKCKSRGIECKYSFVKRPGRKRITPGTAATNSNSKKDTSVNGSEDSHMNSCASPNVSASLTDEVPHSTNSCKTTSDSLFLNMTPPGSIVSTSLTSENNDKYTQISRPGTRQAVESSLKLTVPSAEILRPPSISTKGNIKDPPQRRGTSPAMTTPISIMSENVPDSYFEHELFDMDGMSDFVDGLGSFAPNDIDDMNFVMTSINDTILDSPMSFNHTTNDLGSLFIPMETPKVDSASSADLFTANSEITSPSAISRLSSIATTDLQAPTAMPSTIMLNHSTPTSTCACVLRALDLLKMLSSCCNKTVVTDKADIDLAQATITKNKQILDVISDILVCSSCKNDNLLLIIISILILKVLERYNTTVDKRLCNTGPMHVKEGNGTARSGKHMIAYSKGQVKVPSHANTLLDEATHWRTIAQLVLGELHGVQRLVNQLSPQLKNSLKGDQGSLGVGAGLSAGNCGIVEDNYSLVSTPFSAETLSQLGDDMRKGLKTLSTNIIGRLRHC
ncbi:hypothetical protein QQS21_007614 [Conoideocrella luteorostrata]|uniref:Zn(2)-C6 fungal-type domain-containing protein n=1 Tax=Conoideocrella luteorostrata TaxID=1105319 RepID=A0AAJ0CKB7_9HYPO|nr:hypothetical protein QQS21_007614 [Conoideocrella luteorostrata]